MTYAFVEILDQVLGELEAHGFYQEHSNRKIIRLKDGSSGQEIYIDRDEKAEHRKVSLVFLPRDLKEFDSLSGVVKTASKHSTAYASFPKTLTNTGKMQHEGGRIILDKTASYAAIITEIQRGAK